MRNITSNKRLLINSIASIISFATTVLISFLLTPFLIQSLGKEAYSFYPISNNIIVYIAIFVGALNTMASRYISINLIKGDLDTAKKYFSSVFISNLLISVVFCIPMFVFIYYIELVLNIPFNLISSVKILFLLTLSSMLVRVTTSVYGVATFAKNRIDLRSLRELITSIIKLLLLFFVFYFFPPKIWYIGLVLFIIAILNFSMQKYYSTILTPGLKVSFLNFKIAYLREIVKSSMWNSLLSLGIVLIAGSSMILANIFYGATQAGTYAIVQTIPVFVSGLINMLAGVFFPLITAEYASGNKESLINALKKAQKILALFSSLIITVFIGVSINFFKLWIPTENSFELFRLTIILMIPFAIIGSMWPLMNLNVVMDKVRRPAVFTLMFGGLNIITSYIVFLIWNPGIISLAIISSSTQIIWTFLFLPIYASKILKINRFEFYPTIIKNIITTVLISVLFILLSNQFVISSWISLIILSIIFTAFALIFNLIFNVNKSEKKYLYKSLKLGLQALLNKI